MLVDGWEELFPPRILSRGYDYYLDGRMSRFAPDGDGWRVTIEGTRDYHVFVTENVADSSCDCPYFPEGGLCKHIAAACYEVEDQEAVTRVFGGIAPGRAEEDAGHGKPEPSAEDLVKGLGHEEQLALLLEIVRSDGHWAKQVVRTFGDLEEKRLISEFRAGMDEVVRDHARRGFVDYRHALDCERELCTYVVDFLDPFMRRHAYALVLQLTFTFERLLARSKTEETADIYLDLIAHGTIANQDQLRSWVRKARNRFAEAWPEAKRALIETLDQSPNRLASFLAAEGDYRELMDLLRERGSLSDMNTHRPELAKRYPEEFLARYEQLVRKQVFGPATGRNVYRDHVRTLERMQSLPGGQEAVAGIVRDLREAYPRRTALKEELRRLG